MMFQREKKSMINNNMDVNFETDREIVITPDFWNQVSPRTALCMCSIPC